MGNDSNDHLRKRAEQELVRLNAELERRIQELRERTAELAGANRDLLREVQERQRAEEEVRRLSLTDSLTGLYNRRGFMLLAEQQWKAAHRAKLSCGVLFLDLDGLKRVNDAHGHAAGDALLVAMARLLRQTFREADIVARLGGDEFTVFLLLGPGVGNATARFRAALNEFNRDELRPHELCASVGFADRTADAEESLKQLMARADAAMYGHKRRRNPE